VHDRLFHRHIIGPTGICKTTLLSKLARQISTSGLDFCLIASRGCRAPHPLLGLDCPIVVIADPFYRYGYIPLTYVGLALRSLLTPGLKQALRNAKPDRMKTL
jgi:hypothetical protein